MNKPFWDPAGIWRDTRNLPELKKMLEKRNLPKDKRKDVKSKVKRITDLNGDPKKVSVFCLP